jgi:hypothetical protein
VVRSLAGLVAALAYDLFRLPFVFAHELGIERILPPLQLFKVFPRFGAMILGQPVEQPVYSVLAQLVGWAYHFSNGLTFGIMYMALVGDAKRRLFVNGSVRKVSGLAARSVVDLPLWRRANVRRFIIMMVVDLVPRNGQFCALNCVCLSQYIRVRHRPGPPAGGQCDPSWHLQDSKPKDSWIALK